MSPASEFLFKLVMLFSITCQIPPSYELYACSIIARVTGANMFGLIHKDQAWSPPSHRENRHQSGRSFSEGKYFPCCYASGVDFQVSPHTKSDFESCAHRIWSEMTKVSCHRLDFLKIEESNAFPDQPYRRRLPLVHQSQLWIQESWLGAFGSV